MILNGPVALSGFPGGQVVKNLPACLPARRRCAGDPGSIPGWGRSIREENGTPLQYSCLGNPMDRGVWWATVHGVAKELDTTQGLNHHRSHVTKENKIGEIIFNNTVY